MSDLNFVEQFDKAVKDVVESRNKIYGEPARTFTAMAVMGDVVGGCPNRAVGHALRMIGIKLVRLTVQPDHMDSVIDIAGYARCIAMVLDEQAAAIKGVQKNPPDMTASEILELEKSLARDKILEQRKTDG